MIKFVELTAPQASEFRQAKILSIAVSEGDQIEIGDTLFRVKSGETEIDLPTTRAGRISEIIVVQDENISVMTPLILLETEVQKSTATPPIIELDSTKPTTDTPATKTKKSKNKAKKKSKRKTKKTSKKQSNSSKIKDTIEQQSLDLAGDQQRNSPGVGTQEARNKPVNSNQLVQIKIPDIGGDSAEVVEILVTAGDHISVDDTLITLESDKASMEVPSTHTGVVNEVKLELAQQVEEGVVILLLSVANTAPNSDNSEPATTQEDQANLTKPEVDAKEPESEIQSSNDADSSKTLFKVAIPDIGGDSAKVIEILVTLGQKIELDDPLVTLESDKASMEVPSTVAGTIQSIDVQLDQDVNQGVVVVSVLGDADVTKSNTAKDQTSQTDRSTTTTKADTAPEPNNQTPGIINTVRGKSHASPSVRRFARELGADLTLITGTDRKNRISKNDVAHYVKNILTSKSSGSGQTSSGAGIPAIPAIDFSRFGEIEIKPLNKIKRLTATNLHRSWLNVPHVTHDDESNINDLDSFRKQLNAEYKEQNRDIKLSPLAFIVKAVVRALKAFPQFNSSLEPGGENLIYKNYFNIGIAVETPDGLVVPVLKDADKMSVSEIALQMGELAAKARDKKLSMADMSGACITISSLGGIGGTHFTPIVNAPEVAILGVSRSKIQPVWNGSEFEPGMILPLSLSYDHRVIDGAEAARFTRFIAAALEDVRRLTI